MDYSPRPPFSGPGIEAMLLAFSKSNFSCSRPARQQCEGGACGEGTGGLRLLRKMPGPEGAPFPDRFCFKSSPLLTALAGVRFSRHGHAAILSGVSRSAVAVAARLP